MVCLKLFHPPDSSRVVIPICFGFVNSKFSSYSNIQAEPTHLILQLPHDHFVCSLILGLLNHHLGVLQQSLRPLQVLFQLRNLLLVPAAVKQVLKSGSSIRKDVP